MASVLDSLTKGPDADPEGFARELGAKLASRSRHVNALLGAGASRAAGVPDLSELGEAVKATLTLEGAAETAELFEGRNLEGALTRLRRLIAVLNPDEKLGLFDATTSRRFESLTTRSIIETIVAAKVEPSVYAGFASWAARQDRTTPVEVFTLNYDLLLEQSLDSIGATYFDGFAGSLDGLFRADLVEGTAASDAVPPWFLRVWKLHGSIHWDVREDTTGSREIHRLGGPAPKDAVAAIYPSEEKYLDSRKLPFLALHDRLRRALQVPETVTLVAGYSFGDDHVNEVMFETAKRRPRSELVVFSYDAPSEETVHQATLAPNITVTTPLGLVRGGQYHAWTSETGVPGVFEDGRLLLGDFRHLSSFLARSEAGPLPND